MQTSRTIHAVRAVPILRVAGAVLSGIILTNFTSPATAAPKKHRGTTKKKPAPQSTATNAAMMRRFYDEVFNTGNMDAADKFIAPNFTDYNPFPGQPPTLEGLKKGYPQFRAAFPDLHFTVKDVIAQGNKVMARWSAKGTHKGNFMGMEATGKTVEMHGVDIVRIVNGKAVEHWGYGDDMGLMAQISPPANNEVVIIR